MQDAHRERAGAAGGVENLQVVNGLDELGDLGVGEVVRLIVVGKEVAEAIFGVRRARAGGFQPGREAGDEGFVHHVVDDFARGVEGAGLLAGGGAGLRVVGGEEVLEDLAEQFGVEGDFFFEGGVLFDGEFVAVEDVNQAADLGLCAYRVSP